MTRDKILEKNFPDQIKRIRELSPNAAWLMSETRATPTNTLADAFLWKDTEEGHEFWKKLHDRATDF